MVYQTAVRSIAHPLLGATSTQDATLPLLPFKQLLIAVQTAGNAKGLILGAHGGGVGSQITGCSNQNIDRFILRSGLTRQQIVLTESGFDRLNGVEIAVFAQQQRCQFSTQCSNVAATKEEFAHGTASNQFGYRTGNLIAGAGTIYFASAEGLGLGWATAYGLTAFCIVPAILGALWIGEGQFVDRFAHVAGMSTRQFLTEAVVNPFREFLSRRGAFIILTFVLLYKVGDAMGQTMLSPMIVNLKFADLDYISANKLWGFAALIIGSALGAPFILWLGMGRALLVSGLMMMFSNVMFMILAATGNSYWMLVAAIATENVTSGIGLTVFATYLSGLSNVAYTATQFALLSSFAGVGRTFMAGPAGIVAGKLGWVGFWGFTVLAAVPGMLLLWLLWSKGYVVQSIRQTSGVDEQALRQPIGAGRMLGAALAVVGLVGVLLSQPLKWETSNALLFGAMLVIGSLVAWLAKPRAVDQSRTGA